MNAFLRTFHLLPVACYVHCIYAAALARAQLISLVPRERPERCQWMRYYKVFITHMRLPTRRVLLLLSLLSRRRRLEP
jgi:hypothetical protein